MIENRGVFIHLWDLHLLDFVLIFKQLSDLWKLLFEFFEFVLPYRSVVSIIENLENVFFWN